MRTLIYIPIVHTQADMGGLREPIRRATVEKLGEEGWTHNIRAIDRFWDRISQKIRGWDLPYARVRLYQDGLPVCGREVDIVNDLASVGSRNHQLLLYLMEKGAILMGTESPELLLEEYGLIQQVLGRNDPKGEARMETQQKALSRRLLERRDRYIAERIDASLCPGETGMLFLGMLHSLEGLLARDVRVSYPFHLRARRVGARAPLRRGKP